MEEREGFEPSVPFGTPDFESDAHTSPPMSVAPWSVCFECVLGRF